MGRRRSEHKITSTYLVGERAGPKITKRELEAAVGVVDMDFESHQRVRIGGGS